MDINEIILNDLDEEFLNADITHFRDEWDHYMHEKQYIPRVTQIIHSCQLDNQSLVLWANKYQVYKNFKRHPLFLKDAF